MTKPTHPGPVAAAVDCGTNSTRLLVAAMEDGRLVPLLREQIVTRLGYAVDRTGRLADDAIERTVSAIAGFAEAWREHGASQVRVVGTSAVRDAVDRQRFADAVADRVGQPLEVLTGEEEAALAFAGAVRAVEPPRPALVLDIGGGSTELIVGHDRPAAIVSRQLGCVRLTERALPGDPPGAAAVEAAYSLIDAELDEAVPVIAPHHPATLVAVAGTATTLAALHAGLETYDPDRIHGMRIETEALVELTARLRRMTAAQIATSGPVQPGREDVLLAGALILCRVLERFELAAAVISEGDLLDGMCRAALDPRT